LALLRLLLAIQKLPGRRGHCERCRRSERCLHSGLHSDHRARAHTLEIALAHKG
jgi:hypothetical protein